MQIDSEGGAKREFKGFDYCEKDIRPSGRGC